MNYWQKEKLKKIFKCIADAYLEIDKATDDREADIEFVFGTPTNPIWAEEDHIHLRSGEVVNLKLLESGAFTFAPEHWRNIFGKQIYGVYSPKYWDKKLRNPIKFGWFEGKFQWICKVGFSNSYYIDDARPYPHEVAKEVLYWMIEHFNVENVRQRIFMLNIKRLRREFGLDLKESYYQTKPLKKPRKGDKAINYQAEATYSILEGDS
jgi:hypothetical protein